MMKIFLLILASVVGALGDEGRPEHPNCDWVPWGEVRRMRDLSDCNKFYYCERGNIPLRAGCPKDPNTYVLYFNPTTEHCDYSYKAPKDCFGTGGGGVGVPVTLTTTTTTTTTEPPPTTTTKPPRPPPLNDQSDFEIDCRVRQCGLFPNTYGACDTYVICVNGEKLTKKCNGGQMFDVKTRECQPSNIATCWTEPTAGPHIRRKPERECPFHAIPETKPIQVLSDGMVLQNPVVTNWGDWQNWVNCPAGRYATGIYAWRRLYMEGFQYERRDHVGIISVSFRCQSPGGNETDTFIASLAKGSPNDGWPMYYMCKGAVVGFRLNSQRDLGPAADKLATDNVQAICSCSGPQMKPYDELRYAPQNGHRGDWTAQQICKKGQAVCGMQTQMQEYKEQMYGRYDNTGMNNFRAKCCNVPDPLEKCVPSEKRILVRTCDNSNSDESLRCEFEGEVGLGMDHENQEKLLDFYSSIGYTYDEYKTPLSDKIVDTFKTRIEGGTTMQYTWDDIAGDTLSDPATVSTNTMFARANKKLELYQIVGSCQYFFVRTNRYVKVITDSKTGSRQQEIFEI